MRKIDTHMHMSDGTFRDANDLGMDAGEFREVLDRFGVDIGWISPAQGLYANGEFAQANNTMHRFCRDVGEKRMEMFFTVNPNYGEASVDEVHRCAEVYGARGLKLHSWLQAFPISIPAMDRITEACIAHGIVLLFHDGTPPYASTLQIANLAERYPEATIVLGHSGLTETYDNAISAANRLDNIYLTLCGPSIFQLQKIVDNVPSEKLMWGTDCGFGRSSALMCYRSRMWEYVTMSDEARENIFHRTAERLLPQ